MTANTPIKEKMATYEPFQTHSQTMWHKNKKYRAKKKKKKKKKGII